MYVIKLPDSEGKEGYQRQKPTSHERTESLEEKLIIQKTRDYPQCLKKDRDSEQIIFMPTYASENLGLLFSMTICQWVLFDVDKTKVKNI